jgi:hypothetical protein
VTTTVCPGWISASRRLLEIVLAVVLTVLPDRKKWSEPLHISGQVRTREAGKHTLSAPSVRLQLPFVMNLRLSLTEVSIAVRAQIATKKRAEFEVLRGILDAGAAEYTGHHGTNPRCFYAVSEISPRLVNAPATGFTATLTIET